MITASPRVAEKETDLLRGWLLPVAIFASVIAAYWPVTNSGFVWDDDAHVTPVALRSLDGLWRIWFEIGATQQYYPLLHSAFWIEYRLWGDSALGYHLLNVGLHATVACLFALVLKRLLLLRERAANGAQPKELLDETAHRATSRTAWLAAGLFALHPVGVESVAWIAEQKNTLSAVGYLLSALAYLQFDGTRRWGWYWIGLILFVVALLTKSVTATLPAALLVVLWWRRGRLSLRTDVLPLLPWLVIGAGAGLVTAWVERTLIGAQGARFDFGFVERLLIAGHAACFYLSKLAWPHPLIFIYPRWSIDARSLEQWLFPAAILAVTAVLVLIGRRRRGPLAAAFYFLGTLFPALGFFNVYPFIFSYVADHFQYLASLAAFSLAAAGLIEARRHVSVRPLVVAATPLLLPVLGILTWKQSAIYHDSQTLYRATLERNPGSWLAHDNLGIILAHEGRVPEALAHYEAAIRLNPLNPKSHNNLGNVLARIPARLPEAIAAYEAALRLKPDYAEAHYNLAIALSAIRERLPKAIAEYEAALRLKPDYAEAHYNLGQALTKIPGRMSGAISEYEAALRLEPGYAEAHNNLACVLGNIPGRQTEAIAHFQAALRVKPNEAETHCNFAIVLSQVPGRVSEAVAEYEAALRLKPDFAAAHNGLGVAFIGIGRLLEAVAQFELALKLKPDDAATHYNLAIALSRIPGRLADAQAEYEAALRINPYLIVH